LRVQSIKRIINGNFIDKSSFSFVYEKARGNKLNFHHRRKLKKDDIEWILCNNSM
jgi:hypothetical protein